LLFVNPVPVSPDADVVGEAEELLVGVALVSVLDVVGEALGLAPSEDLEEEGVVDGDVSVVLESVGVGIAVLPSA
jgi:hypothetical protein